MTPRQGCLELEKEQLWKSSKVILTSRSKLKNSLEKLQRMRSFQLVKKLWLAYTGAKKRGWMYSAYRRFREKVATRTSFVQVHTLSPTAAVGDNVCTGTYVISDCSSSWESQCPCVLPNSAVDSERYKLECRRMGMGHISSAQCKSVVSAFWSFCRRSHFMLKIPLFSLFFDILFLL